MNIENMIEVPRDKLAALVKGAYDLSMPVGMGFLQPYGASLSDEDVQSMIHEDSYCVVSMDYVNGRQCKFNIWKEGEKFYINKRWYGHSDSQLVDLLDSAGIKR